MKKLGEIVLCAAMVMPLLHSQQPNAQQPGAGAPQPAANAVESIRPTYVLGAGDQITIRALDAEGLSDRPFRIDSEGNVNLPGLGQVHAAGLTVEQFEADLTERLKATIRNPVVSVNVVQFHSEPVFVTGLFKNPGIITLQGRRTLMEVLTSVGGVQPNASRRIRVTRHLEMGVIPLPTAVVDQEKKVSTVEISIASLRENINPAEDIVLQPLDTISAERAELVYVNGEVNHVGGIELGERDSISITQLITMVGGLGKDAAGDKARILRPVLNTSRRAEIPVDLKKILSGKQSDFPLLPNDVLFVPRSSHKVALSKASLIALPMATSLIYVLVTRL